MILIFKKHNLATYSILILCIFLNMKLVAHANETTTGILKEVSGNSMVLDSLETFVPSNEHAKIPLWAIPGIRVKVTYYVQKNVRYYIVIAKDKPEKRYSKYLNKNKNF